MEIRLPSLTGQMELTARVTWKQRDDKERTNVCNHWNHGQRRR